MKKTTTIGVTVTAVSILYTYILYTKSIGEHPEANELSPASKNSLLTKCRGPNDPLRNAKSPESCNLILEKILKDVKFNKTCNAVNPICSIETCWNWKRCLHGKNLKFCTQSKSKLRNSLLITLSQFPHWFSSCNSEDVCAKIVATSNDAMDCIHEQPDVSKPTCIAIFTEASESKAFYKKIANQKIPLVRFPIAATFFPQGAFRSGFDFMLSELNPQTLNGAQEQSVQIYPPHRPILVTFLTGRENIAKGFDVPVLDYLNEIHKYGKSSLLTANAPVILHLARVGQETDECWREAGSERTKKGQDSVLYSCRKLARFLQNSTFGLVVLGELRTSTPSWRTQLLACFANGAIPVIIGAGMFPGDEAIKQSQWDKAIVRIPEARTHQLISIVQQFTDSDIFEMRRQGQMLYQRHFAGQKARISTLLLAISRRLGFRPPDAPVVKRNLIFFGKPAQKNTTTAADKRIRTSPNEVFEIKHSVKENVDQVNPFWTYPSTPWDEVLPSDFTTDPNLHRFYDPVLGYEHPYEEFTVVLLVYDRIKIAYNLVKSLENLNYLSAVLVIHNNPNATSMNTSWPKIHVPVYVIQSPVNSLNSRFIPYDLIKTDAILCMDDDYVPDHRWIISAFRVWRSNRERNIGYAARLHVHEADSWKYGLDGRQRYSIILTSVSFFHRYYLYAYTYDMPEKIRQLVDETMNCEDIAMNFLISHLTRKPPLKTAQNAHFACHGCKSSLSLRPKHYVERSRCVHKLKEIYGYMPLLYTSDQAQILA